MSLLLPFFVGLAVVAVLFVVVLLLAGFRPQHKRGSRRSGLGGGDSGGGTTP